MRSTTFDKALTLLAQSERPLSPTWLREFSDLAPQEVRQFLNLWPQLSQERKYAFLDTLKLLFDEETLVSFEAIGRVLLDDADAGVRCRALRLLEESVDLHLVPQLLRMLAQDGDTEVRAEAAAILGPFVYEGELENLPSHLLRKIEDALLYAAEHDAAVRVRQKALISLGFSSRPEVEALIRSAYQQQEPEWIACSLSAMGRSADPHQWQEYILPMLSHEDAEIRRSAVLAAGELGLKQARPILLRMLEEEPEEAVYKEAIWALSQIGGENVRLYLETLLEEAETEEMEEWIEDALDNLDFTEDFAPFDLLRFDVEDLDSFGEEEEKPFDE
ncbi:MAG: HEAT repeat domain-containing protein [Anaerolineales bacterium]